MYHVYHMCVYIYMFCYIWNRMLYNVIHHFAMIFTPGSTAIPRTMRSWSVQKVCKGSWPSLRIVGSPHSVLPACHVVIDF